MTSCWLVEDDLYKWAGCMRRVAKDIATSAWWWLEWRHLWTESSRAGGGLDGKKIGVSTDWENGRGERRFSVERFWGMWKNGEPKKQKGTFAKFEEAMESSAWSQAILAQRESFMYNSCILCTLPFLYHPALFLWLCLGFSVRRLQPCLFIYSSNYLYLKSILVSPTN